MCDRVHSVVRPRPASAEEVAAHEASGHAAYRSWCPFCVQGKAKASAHRRQDDIQADIPEVVADFASGQPLALDGCKCLS